MQNMKYFFLVFLILLTSCNTINNETKSIEADKKLRLVLKTKKDVYSLGEAVVVELYFQNLSQENIWLLKPYIKGVNLLKKENRKTKKDIYYSTSSQRKKLLIGAGTEVLYNITSFDQTYFSSKGKWTLQIAERFTKVVDGWGGDISSNVIVVTIN